MSKEIRKTRKQIEKGFAPVEGCHFYTNDVGDGIVAYNLRDAKELLSLHLFGKPFTKIKQARKDRINNYKWEIIDPNIMIGFSLSDSPGWEPEDEAEEDDPPWEEDYVKNIIKWWGRKVVYTN